jgi:hypothetical protein
MRCDNKGSAWALVVVVVLVLLSGGLCYGSAQQTAPGKPSPEAAQNASTTNPPPALQMGETSFDFGDVDEGETIRHDFKVKNTGAGELQITRVSPG